MSKPKRNEKYLKLDESGVWHLIFRVPACFGGKLIRQSIMSALECWCKLDGTDSGMLIYGGSDNYTRNGMRVRSGASV